MFVHVMNLRNYSLLADSISEWTLKTFYPGWQQEWNLRKLVSNTHGMPRNIRLQKPNSTRKFICNKLCPLQFWWLKFQRHVISLKYHASRPDETTHPTSLLIFHHGNSPPVMCRRRVQLQQLRKKLWHHLGGSVRTGFHQICGRFGNSLTCSTHSSWWFQFLWN